MSGAKKPQGAGYKRSWKNYFLNARYQLRFTGFLVAICALLMVMMGWWIDDMGRGAHWLTSLTAWRSIPAIGRIHIDGNWPSVMSEAENGTKVGEISIKGNTLDFEDPDHDEQLKTAKIAALHHQENLLELVLAGTVVLLSFGLFAFGILMTHKVAGPLFKVGLYLDKMKAGKYDKVYNLRKGDQLVDFFDHFKEAHSALRKIQEQDVQHLKDLIAAAEKQDAAKVPQLTALLDELRALQQKKEAGLV